MDNLEAKAIQSMQYHVDTSNALMAIQSQMFQMMEMMQNIAHNEQSQNDSSTNADGVPPSSSLVMGNEHPVHNAAIVGVLSKQDTHYEGSRSVASSSSGSQHAQPPQKKL